MRAIMTGVLAGALAVGGHLVRAEQAAVAPTVAPASPSGAVDDEFYDPTGRRDPFRPPQARAIATTGADRSPLQRYEIGQLKLVAVIYDTVTPRAVVEDEAGLGYIVKVGTEIGVNGGTVRAIDRARVLVEEESVDFFGESRSSEVILEMSGGERGSR